MQATYCGCRLQTGVTRFHPLGNVFYGIGIVGSQQYTCGGFKQVWVAAHGGFPRHGRPAWRRKARQAQQKLVLKLGGKIRINIQYRRTGMFVRKQLQHVGIILHQCATACLPKVTRKPECGGTVEAP